MRNKKGGSGNWIPLAVMLSVILVIGGVVFMTYSAFSSSSSNPNPDNSGSVYNLSVTYINSSFISTIPTGLQLFNGTFFVTDVNLPSINFLALFGQDVKDFFISLVTSATYIPSWLLIPIIVFTIGAIIWTGVKLIFP